MPWVHPSGFPARTHYNVAFTSACMLQGSGDMNETLVQLPSNITARPPRDSQLVVSNNTGKPDTLIAMSEEV